MRYLIFVFISTILSTEAFTQNSSSLQMSEIMKGEDFVGYLPSSIRWSEDSKKIYFSWNPDQDTLRSTYQVVVDSKDIRKLTVEELKSMTGRGDYSSDYKMKVYASNGDIFLQDLSDYQVLQVTNTNSREYSPEFSGDDKHIIYRMDDNLYAWSIAAGTTRQLTDFRTGSERKDSESEQDKWLERDQLAYFDVLQKRKAERDAREYRNKLTEPKRPITIYMGSKRLAGSWASPNLNHIVYRLYKDANVENTSVPDFVTQSGYTRDLRARSKVGGPRDEFETYIYDIGRDTTYRVMTDAIDGILDKPAFLREYEEDSKEYEDKYEKPRRVRIGEPIFSAGGKAVVNITSEDYKDRWIMLLDLATGELDLIDRQRDEAWIGGPGVGWFSNGVGDWLDEDNIWFKSEESGYTHLYTANVNTGKKKALTKGEFEVLDVELSRDKRTFFLTSNKVSPHEQHFYHLPVRGGKMQRITTQKGGHEVTVSPDEQWLAIRYSRSNDPWELYLMPNEEGADMEQITESTTEAFEGYDWRVPEIVRFEARDGERVPASLYEPAADKKNGAAVIFVHGAGYLQNVHYWWPSYYREYMFHNMLADNGYTVLAIDFRASAGYGRDWRTAIYRHMGGKDLTDQVDGANYLVDEYEIDKDRIGIYGGSYGGFITLMAMFKEPGVFQSGAALRSVTDWAHYNHGYTANILNTPVQDSIAYARSSPIYFAEGLEGQLVMLHGMIDTNVHFQDVVRLSQRLIELGKEDWDLAVFPVERHGFVEASSWTDEYRRIFELFNETLLEPERD